MNFEIKFEGHQGSNGGFVFDKTTELVRWCKRNVGQVHRSYDSTDRLKFDELFLQLFGDNIGKGAIRTGKWHSVLYRGDGWAVVRVFNMESAYGEMSRRTAKHLVWFEDDAHAVQFKLSML